MPSFRFIHCADLHLDTPFRGIENVDSEIAGALRDASLEALRNIVREAIARSVDFVVFSGDIYDGAKRGLRAQIAFRSALAELGKHDIRAFIIHGNHDPLDGWSAIAEFPANTHVYSAAYEAVPFTRDGVVLATIHGASYGENHVRENLSLRYQATGQGFEIGLLHTDVGKVDSPYAPCALDDLTRSGIDYWALGHIHDRQVLCQQPMVVYPGNHQGRSFSEEGAKGVYCVEVDGKTVRSIEFVEVGTWQFKTVTVDAGVAADIAELADRIQTGVEDERTNRNVILRVRVVGKSAVHGLLAREGTGAIAEQLRTNLRSMRPRVWLARIENKTRPTYDIDTVLGRDDFSSEVVRMAATWKSVPDVMDAVPAKYRGALERFTRGYLADPDDTKLAARDLALENLLGGKQ